MLRSAMLSPTVRSPAQRGDGARADAGFPFASVVVHEEATALDAAWAALETQAVCTIYQTRRFVQPWLATMGRRAGMRAMLVVAYDDQGHPVALLPLGLREFGPLRIATFLGGKDSNFGLPLLRRDAVWTSEACRALLRDAARVAPTRPHLFVFRDQPASLDGWRNPFASLPSRPSSSPALGTALSPDVEAWMAGRLSKDTRKKLRKKEAKLETFGPVAHAVARTPEDTAAAIDALLGMKVAWLEAQGIASPLASPDMRAFLAEGAARGGIELHVLKAGPRIVAVYAGGAHDGRWSGMINAFDADPEIARTSPGDLLLMRIVAKAATDGLTRFDLGIGIARYKATICDETIALRDAVVATGPVGRLAAVAVGTALAAKHRVKASPTLLGLARRAARGLGSRTVGR